jgi:hypothetical protein
MKLNNIVEGVRTGKKELSGYSGKKDYTIGFEFEIATPNLGGSLDPEDAWENFTDNWYSSTDHSQLESDCWQDFNKTEINNIVKDYNLKPRYGYPKRDEYDERQSFLDFYEPTEEDLVDTDKKEEGIVLNEDGEEVNIYEIATPEDFFNLFKPNKYDTWREDYYFEYEQERMSEDFTEYMNQNRNSRNSDNALEYIKDVFERELNINIKLNVDDYSRWTLTTDGSVKPDGGELRSPILNIQDGIKALKRVCQIIDNDDEMETNDSTGLHVNIGTFSDEDLHKIDFLKFLLLVGENHVLDVFDRRGNAYAEQNIYTLIQVLSHNNIKSIKDYENAKSEINRKIISSSTKYSFANLSKLIGSKNKYIEIRAPGGEDYHLKYNEVVETINRVIRFLDIAADPNAYRNEYLQKLYKFFGDKSINQDTMSKNRKTAGEQSILNQLQKDLGVNLAMNYVSIIQSIIYRLENNIIDENIINKHSINLRNLINDKKTLTIKSQLSYKINIVKNYLLEIKPNISNRLYTFLNSLLN